MNQEAQMVIVRVGKSRFALDVQLIREIIKLKPITPIPHAPGFVEGLINLRGQIVSVINLGQRLSSLEKGFEFNAEPQPLTEERIVVMNQGVELIGLRVDAVDQVMTIDTDSLEHPDESGKQAQGIVDGVFQTGDSLVLKLKSGLLLQPLNQEGVG